MGFPQNQTEACLALTTRIIGAASLASDLCDSESLGRDSLLQEVRSKALEML